MTPFINHPRIYVLCLSVLLACSGIRADEIGGPARIYLRGGGSISFTILRVHPWGITNDREESVSFRVVDSLFTSDSSDAFTIIHINNSVELEHTTDGYMLTFAAYVAPTQPPEAPEPVTPHSISLFYRYDNSSGISFQYDAKLFNSQHFIHRFQGSMSFRSDEPPFASLSFSLGLGYRLEFQNMRFSVVTSFGLFGGDPSNGSRSELSTVVILSPVVSYQIEPSYRLFLIGGLDVFLHRERDDLPPLPAIGFLGVGIGL